MNAQTHDAYLARAELAELRARELNARVKRLESQAQDAFHLHVSTEQRIAALEAAARAIVADCRVPRGEYLGDSCRWCENTIDRDGHRPGCPVGVLLPLLEEG